MKFLCVPCDTPMKLQTVAPPDRGSLSVVYPCPECGYEIAMLTNQFETQMVQSLGVRIGPASATATADSADLAPFSRRRAQCPFARDGGFDRQARAVPRRRRSLDGRCGSTPCKYSGVRASDGPHRHRAVRTRARRGRSGREGPGRRARSLRDVIAMTTMPLSAERVCPPVRHLAGTSPTAVISPASTAISTPAAALSSAPRTSRTAASSAPMTASGSSTRSPTSHQSA